MYACLAVTCHLHFWHHGPVYASSPCLKWCPTAGVSLFRIISPVISGNRLLQTSGKFPCMIDNKPSFLVFANWKGYFYWNFVMLYRLNKIVFIFIFILASCVFWSTSTVLLFLSNLSLMMTCCDVMLMFHYCIILHLERHWLENLGVRENNNNNILFFFFVAPW